MSGLRSNLYHTTKMPHNNTAADFGTGSWSITPMKQPKVISSKVMTGMYSEAMTATQM